jgi:Meiotically up-regulated gene 113
VAAKKSATTLDDLYIIGVDLEAEPGWEIAAGRVKIGRSGDSAIRFSTLQSASPVPLKILHTEPRAGCFEIMLHRKFADLRRHGEWFEFGDRLPVPEILAVLAALQSAKAEYEKVPKERGWVEAMNREYELIQRRAGLKKPSPRSAPRRTRNGKPLQFEKARWVVEMNRSWGRSPQFRDR